jgi:hypothetical protein
VKCSAPGEVARDQPGLVADATVATRVLYAQHLMPSWLRVECAMADTTVQGAVENWVRDTWMPARLGQQFTKGRRRLAGGGEFEFDGISEDGSIVACISTSRHKTSGGKNGMGKWFKLRSDMLYLLEAVGVNRRLLVLTEPCMFKHYEAERGRGRVPREVEVFLVEIPSEMRDRLVVSRERASREVRPVSG